MTDERIKLIRENTEMAEDILCALIETLAPGVSTADLNQKAKEEFATYDALPAAQFLNAKDHVSIAINDEVLFGEISEKKKIQHGDVVKIALGVFKHGYFSDIGYTVIVGDTKDERKQQLIAGTQDALLKAVAALHAGVTVGDVSSRIESALRSFHLQPICDIMGHGIGRNLHEPPSIPNCTNLPFIDYSYRFKENDIICIEPFATTGKGTLHKNNGSNYSFSTLDGAPVAHFEFPILVTEHGAQPLAQKIFASLHHDITPKPPGTVEWE